MREPCPTGTRSKTDVCIVGAGAAGITIAQHFIGKPFRVCLMESGGLDFDARTQSLYSGETAGLPYTPLDAVRVRYFGGTTNHWNGWCRPFEELDFEHRDWVPYSGWPFKRSELVPYYERAHEICELGPFAYSPETLGKLKIAAD
jgi:choline dehydrogenase-like flavoprotein